MFQHLRRHPDRLIVLITHRLANVRHAAQIFVLHDGRLVQQGNHDELMAQAGLYRELFDLQAAGYLAEPPAPAQQGS
jgi:ATP-binding cassette subfamily B protein